MKLPILISFIIGLILISCQPQDNNMDPEKSKMYNHLNGNIPQAEKIKKSLVTHGDERIDYYYWLNERENPEVIDYLKSENAYVDQVLKHTEKFQTNLFDEMVARIKKDDSSVPYKQNGYYYTDKYEAENEYPMYTRGKTPAGNSEILIDQNKLAMNHKFHSLRGLEVSPNNKLLLYGEDTLSRRIYTLRIKDLETGEMLPDIIPNTSANAAWANDNKTFFYMVKDEALRPYKVYRHVLGTPVSEDALVFHEEDETFYSFIYRSNSNKYIILGSTAILSTEYRTLDADDPLSQFKIFQPRTRDLEYEIDHFENKFYVRTNLSAKNFQLMQTPESKTTKENWKTVVEHRPKVFLEDFDVFNKFLVLTERHKGISKIKIRNHDGESHFIDFNETVYSAGTFDNFDFDSDVVRIGFSSMITPKTTYDYDTKSKQLIQLKRQEILGDFDSNHYESIQVQAPAKDGTLVPISLVYKKGLKKDASNAVYLIGYGSYGSSYDPGFSSVRLSLLDRGMIVGIAHIRGGQELGRSWYEDGKLLKKKNTFTDFIDCADYLINEKYADPNRMFAYGGSAGGLLMGAITNMRPDLWAGVVSAVPFVDVVTTMLDESIPLTTGEYDEWGNPNDKEYYDYIKSYSPYDNIEAKAYPPILVTTGLHDSQVQYWEPAKYIAKLREYKTNNQPLLFHTNLEAGHGGASGRFSRLREWALHYTFVLDLANEMHEKPMCNSPLRIKT